MWAQHKCAHSFLGNRMIRNIIKVTLFFAIVISSSSIAQVAMALDSEALDLDLRNISSNDPYHSYVWTTGAMQPRPGYQLITSPTSGQDASYSSGSIQKKFSWEIYSGDGLDDLRNGPYRHKSIYLPEEDEEAYGISIKQRF